MSRARSRNLSPKPAMIAGMTLLAALLTMSAAQAEPDGAGNGNGDRGGRRGPPPEAFDACTALIEGDSCAFVNRCEIEVTGTCATARNDELVCRPADRGSHGHGKGHGGSRDQQDRQPESQPDSDNDDI